MEAASTASLSFEVPGNVREVNVDMGEQISKGQVLARLDEGSFKLNVEAAQAAVGRAEVELSDARTESDRLQRLAERNRGFVAEQTLDQAQAAYDAGRKNLSYATSRLNLAQRDLERTALRAPFEGVIAERHVDPFQEVDRGQKLFDLFVEGVMEASSSIPESDIKMIYLGLPGEVRFPAIPGQIYKGIVTEISQAAGAANAFPVSLTIQADSARIRPGLTTEVSLLLGDEQGDKAYLIPIGSLVPRGGESGDYVYVFDAETSTVKKTLIEHDGIRDNNIVVTKGLNAGDIIAVAGVSFLRDGQKVRLM